MATQHGPRGALTVRLQIYSGRPDPEWTLEPDAADEVARQVRQAMSAAPGQAPPEGGLGYRGFRITGGEAFGLPSELAAFRGVVSEVTGKRTRHWPDTAGLERSLIEDARKRGFAEVLDALGVK